MDLHIAFLIEGLIRNWVAQGGHPSPLLVLLLEINLVNAIITVGCSVHLQ